MVNVVTEVVWDQNALSLYLTTVAEEHLPELADEVRDLTYMLAPVRTRRTAVPRWAKRGYVGMPGRLKASVITEHGRDYVGPYADIAALWYGRFMDPKARQLHRLIPFLPSALQWTLEGREFHW